jgi:adenylate cyclase
MSLTDDLNSMVWDILTTSLIVNQSNSVPEPDDVALKAGAKKLTGTVLYADIAYSSELVEEFQQKTAAKVYKCFLNCCSKLIIANNGVIRSFDGDRVMGIFIGDSKDTNATKTGLQIKYVVNEIIKPKLKTHFQSMQNTGYEIDHGVGIDTSDFLAIRTGLKGSNDIVWIGRAPNFAAKLCSIREDNYNIYISEDVYNKIEKSFKYNKDSDIWECRTFKWIKQNWTIYRTSYHCNI